MSSKRLPLRIPALALAALLPGAALAGGDAAGDIAEGRKVYQHYCVTCHGVNADGAGPASKLFKPPPANLLKSTLSDDSRAAIIRAGGAAVGRSAAMPPWSMELNEGQIDRVVLFLATLNKGGRRAP